VRVPRPPPKRCARCSSNTSRRPAISLAAQGTTSGPVWDRIVTNLLSVDDAEHYRLRRLVSAAFAA
jgi:cytochrome P450